MQSSRLVASARQIGLAALASLGVAALGSLTWGPLLVANLAVSPRIPWAVAVEAVLLLLIWLFLGGRGWPRRTSAARRELLRSRVVPPRAFAWAWVAGALSLAALAGLWIVLVELTGAGGNPTLPSTAQYPALVVGLFIAMGSLVSPLTEEAAFRGYGQVLLERRFRPVLAVGLSSLFFALYHGPTQGFAPSKILFYFTVGIVFGTTALMTRSVLPAIPVHIAGDLLFFTLIWPNDAGRPLVRTHGADAAFWLLCAEVVVFGALACAAFWRLRRAGGGGEVAPGPHRPLEGQPEDEERVEDVESGEPGHAGQGGDAVGVLVRADEEGLQDQQWEEGGRQPGHPPGQAADEGRDDHEQAEERDDGRADAGVVGQDPGASRSVGVPGEHREEA
jgi:membrane protease YdiL (CAAX protease family)